MISWTSQMDCSSRKKKVVQHNRMLYGEAEDHTMKLFQRMDRQGKGYLSALDLKRGMKLIGLSLTNEQVEQLIIEMDDNGDGKIQPEELSTAIHEGGRNPKVVNVRKSRSIPSHKVPRQKSPKGGSKRVSSPPRPQRHNLQGSSMLDSSNSVSFEKPLWGSNMSSIETEKKLTHQFRMISWTFQMGLFQS